MTKLPILLLALAAFTASATEDHHKKPPTVIVVEKHDHDAVAALVGAGVTYWLMRRYHKRHDAASFTIGPTPPTCEPAVQQLQETVRATEERLGRAVEACGKGE